jgi:hypothetical protein
MGFAVIFAMQMGLLKFLADGFRRMDGLFYK